MSIPVTETLGQARQGSVAAIIQVFNERLADSGIRTRAVIDGGILQLLCEAPSSDRLEKTAVVEKVRQVLETIGSHHIKGVKINSRIVKEEQLLWLDEINKDPENALLWSEVITLKKQPFFIQRWLRDYPLTPKASRDVFALQPKPNRLLSKLLGIGSVGIAALVLVTGWTFREDIRNIQPGKTAIEIANTKGADTKTTSAKSATTTEPLPISDAAARATDTLSTTPSPTAEPTTTPAEKTNQPNQPASEPGNSIEAFSAAVRIAEKASTDGQTAATAAEWLDLAARWQRAADLMAQVSSDFEQHPIAQNRVSTYSANSKTAIKRATAL